MSFRFPRRAALLVAALPLAACTAPVHLEPAPAAPDPICARMLQKMPRNLAGLEKVSTDAQATTAYGADAPITVRCGLEPPPPTTDRCIAVSAKTDADAETVDWINPEAGSDLLPDGADEDAWTFITYGRSPAIEVVVPVEAGLEQPTAALLEMEKAVETIPAERRCVGATDITQ